MLDHVRIIIKITTRIVISVGLNLTKFCSNFYYKIFSVCDKKQLRWREVNVKTRR